MSTSAAILAVVAVVASFLPQEVLAALGLRSDGLEPVIVQALGAAYAGFAILNWLVRDSTMGGIYGRPLVLGNLTHFLVAGLAVLRAAFEVRNSLALWLGAVLLLALATAFGVVMMRNPRASNPGQ